MVQIHTIQEGLLRLFSEGQRMPVSFIYEEATHASICEHIIVNNDRIPVFSWRYHGKYSGIRSTLSELGELSMLKTLSFAPGPRTMEQELFRELDLAEYLLGSKVSSIMGYGTPQAANFIVRMENGTVANLEMAVTMPDTAKPDIKHTIFTTNGMICDRATDAVVAKEQIYLFNDGKDPIIYTDDDVNLFGLTLEQQDTCYTIYALLDGREDGENWKAQVCHLRQLTEGALQSLKSGKKYIIS